MKIKRNGKPDSVVSNWLIVAVVIVVVMMMTLVSSCYTVGTGHVGIPVMFGKVTGEPVSEGLHFINPLASLKKYDIRENMVTEETEIFTKDTQQTNVDFRFTYALNRARVGEIYQTIGQRDVLETVVIKPRILGMLKDEIGQIVADELIAKREEITSSVKRKLAADLDAVGIRVVSINFTNINFSNAYEQSVEAKVVAAQRALEARNKTVQVEEESKQTVMKAKAEAESMDIRAKALQQNRSLVEYEAVQKWDGKLPVTMMGGAVPFIQLPGGGK